MSLCLLMDDTELQIGTTAKEKQNKTENNKI